MRIIAGQFRGRNLQSPDGHGTRPITDKAKESVFNILGHRWGLPGDLPDFDVLDLFAGSGGLGIEALSRGARSCLFVERDRRTLQCLRHNVTQLRVGVRCSVVPGNAWTMRIPRPFGGRYGLIFVDPPFRDVEKPEYSLDLLERLAPALTEDGVIVFRHEIGTTFPRDTVRALRCFDAREFGRMTVLFYEHAPQSPATPQPSAEPPDSPSPQPSEAPRE